jgi:hypothetical protein
VGAVEDEQAIYGICDHQKEFTPFRDLVRSARAGEAVPKLRARASMCQLVQEGFIRGERPVTITLREADHWRHRNSHRPSWMAFARELEAAGKSVIFVRDTARANEPIPGFRTCPLASVHLEARVALYEASECNLFVSNGPSSLAWFGTRPFLLFVSLDEDGAFSAGTTRWWHEYCDMTPGDQFPWSAPDQRLIWDIDNYENIQKAWKELNDGVSIAA